MAGVTLTIPSQAPTVTTAHRTPSPLQATNGRENTEPCQDSCLCTIRYPEAFWIHASLGRERLQAPLIIHGKSDSCFTGMGVHTQRGRKPHSHICTCGQGFYPSSILWLEVQMHATSAKTGGMWLLFFTAISMKSYVRRKGC